MEPKEHSIERRISPRQAEILLAAVIAARGTSFVFSKICLGTMEPFTLLAARFLIAFLFLVLLMPRRLRALRRGTFFRGAALGIIFFAVMTAELNGLKTTDSSTASLLENTAIVLVPLLEAALHRKAPGGRILLGDCVALAGVALLALEGGRLRLGPGGLLCLLAAVLYAVGIIATNRFSRRDDPITLGMIQVGTIGALALAASVLTETPRLPATGLEWGCILCLAVVCSGFGFTLQPLAQSRTSSETAGLFCAINPLVAAVLGVLVLREGFTLWKALGAALILLAILLSRSGRPHGNRVDKPPAEAVQ